MLIESKIKVYPGMISQDIEFFFDGEDTRYFQNGSINEIDELPNYILEKIQEIIDSDTDSKTELEIMYPNDKPAQIKKFIKCRFGGLDYKADISKHGKIQAGEYWNCPVRGNCRAEGKICKQVRYKDQIISELEIKIIKHLCSDYTRVECAEKLNLPFGTFDYHTKKLFRKLEVVNQAQLTSRAILLNIIQPE